MKLNTVLPTSGLDIVLKRIAAEAAEEGASFLSSGRETPLSRNARIKQNLEVARMRPGHRDRDVWTSSA